MATHGAQEGLPGEQGRRTGFRPRKAVDYVQVAQGYTKDDEGDEDYVEEDVTADDEENDTEVVDDEVVDDEVVVDDEGAKDTEVVDDEKAPDVGDNEEAKHEEKSGNALDPNKKAFDFADLVGDDDDTTATHDKIAHGKAKPDGGIATAVGDNDGMFSDEDDDDTVSKANDVVFTDAVMEESEEGAGSKRQAFEESIRQFVRAAREGAEAAARTPNASRTAAPAPSTNPSKQVRGPMRKPAQSADASPPPKRAKVGREEEQRTVVKAAGDQPASRHRERRRTKTWGEREKIVKAHQAVDNLRPHFSKKSFDNWGEFEDMPKTYQDANFVLYRVRSSQSTQKYNSLPGVQKLPGTFTHQFKTMWCTHGTKQASRGEGLREKGQRYTGCEASFTVRSVKCIEGGVPKWKVCIDPETEIYLHNHKTTKTIYESYKRGKSLPLTAEVRKDLGFMVEVQTSTPAINRYLSDKLGMIITPQQTRNILQQVLGSTTVERTRLLLETAEDVLQAMGRQLGDGLDARDKQLRLPSRKSCCDVGN
ncbi:hypothetical protein PF008_g8658 [Phytophthora fragariae]|uniref:Uncharacterized protein n=1 Tax=Phytophthora fragariae TaxID=53985 RepID=A0A6G0RYV7_9STRA|nr:hypothetical protein PF008_g8658 [Phytophthora fragariae]